MAEPWASIAARVDGEAGRAARVDVALSFAAPITVVTGPSGAGKSTLLSLLAGLVAPSSGSVTLFGDVVADTARGLSIAPRARGVGLVFQSLALFPHLSVVENVAYGARAESRALRLAHAHAWLARLHVAHAADRSPRTLSGGEAQRVAIARALAAEPRALLLDEPFAALDRALHRAVRDDVLAVLHERRTPAVLVTHDLDDARAAGGPVVEIASGRVAVDGESAPRT
mgnify:CR=1 FL=1